MILYYKKYKQGNNVYTIQVISVLWKEVTYGACIQMIKIDSAAEEKAHLVHERI